MSTVKAINIQHPTALSVNMTLDSSANVGINTATPGSTLDVKGTIRLSGSSSGYVGIAPAAAAGSTTYTMPSADGSSGQVLSTNGSGTLSWASASAFPAGTAMLFVQTAAPTGWTKSVTHDNKALRIVSGAASSGGSVAFTTAFASQAVSGSVGSTTLATSQIPSHAHSYTAPSILGGGGFGCGNYPSTTGATTGAQGGGGSHNHSFSGTAINLAVQYVDAIIATKN
jgi:hypothetical protein